MMRESEATMGEGLQRVYKWLNAPKSKSAADQAIKSKWCPICSSKLLLALVRPPLVDWRVHCNHCGMEVAIAVLINREAWTQIARQTESEAA